MKRLSLLSLALLTACVTQQQATLNQITLNYTVPDQPEAASSYTEKQAVISSKWMVAAANPLATDAGAQVLRAGGSAVDAAIAVQMVLGLVEPQSSGIGGGAFLLHYKPPIAMSQSSQAQVTQGFQESSVQAFDGRETAPATTDERLFLDKDGKPMPFIDAVVGGRSIGTPGAVKMLEMAHREHGKLAWSALFEPAIKLAEEGFKVSLRLNTLLAGEQYLKKDATAANYFYDTSGKPWAVGTVLKNPEYAAVLRMIAKDGATALHTGEVAQAIVNKVQSHPTNAGKLTMSDLAGYQPKMREALCAEAEFQRKQTTVNLPIVIPSKIVCGFPPPSSGAIAIAQMFGIWHHVNALRFGGSSDDNGDLHVRLEASRLAFADRAQYLGDPDFISPPAGSWKSLLDSAYLKERAALIGSFSMKTAKPGLPQGAKTSYAPMPHQTEYGTSHISIVDGYGNALAMTTTIEDQFGSRQMVNRGKGLSGGFLLNNELTDFSFTPTDAAGVPIANRVQALKRPRSSMSPTLVFDKDSGAFVASVGSPGGALIIHYTAKALYAMLAQGLDPQAAVSLPNFGSLNGPTLLEEKRFVPEVVEALKARGHDVREMPMTSGLQAIMKTATGYIGGADPRREGVVIGDK